jgi:hypothetical protein|tara:strand:+ start:855 stop:1181 length:327 start_codon:yes stop_codon:yes gene_type:complete
MAHSYKFSGKSLTTTAQTSILTASSGETIIIKSIVLSNNSSNTPTATLEVTDTSASATYKIINTTATTANTAQQLITEPLILEETDILKITMSSTDAVDISMSYLSIT